MANFAPINSQLNYQNSAPYSSSLMPGQVYRQSPAQPNQINFSMESREEYTPYNTTNLANTVLRQMIEDNEISRLYFSTENIRRVQKKIKAEVYNQSNGKFKLDEDQDESDLIVVMRYIYLEHCKNLPGHEIKQVKILNDKVVKYVLPDIITNIKQYYGYIKDISTPITPVMRPMATTSAGRRTLPSIATLWR